MLATITMDAAMVAASSLGGSASTTSRYGPDMIGHWMAGLVRGRWRNGDIRSEPAQRGELGLGLLTHNHPHAGVPAAPASRGWATELPGATAFGIATAALQFLVLFPSMGYGWFGLRSGEAARVIRVTLSGHTAFGVGIGLSGPRFAEHRPRP